MVLKAEGEPRYAEIQFPFQMFTLFLHHHEIIGVAEQTDLNKPKIVGKFFQITLCQTGQVPLVEFHEEAKASPTLIPGRGDASVAPAAAGAVAAVVAVVVVAVVAVVVVAAPAEVVP